jgi:hypothetical protein
MDQFPEKSAAGIHSSSVPEVFGDEVAVQPRMGLP